LHQPFEQVPWLTDGEISTFESGAILLHIGNRSDKVMPTDPQQRAEAVEWLFAALNSVEMTSLPWSIKKLSKDDSDAPFSKQMDEFLTLRLKHLENVVAKREWLAGSFSVADILMADVLRLVDRFDGLLNYPACKTYLAKALARPAFQKAHADQLAFFAEADKKRTH
jgi:glutathione S-transferase